jgi:hypothetical protein
MDKGSARLFPNCFSLVGTSDIRAQVPNEADLQPQT